LDVREISKKLEFVDGLPFYGIPINPTDAELLPDDFIGAVIIRFGGLREYDNRLAMEYRPRGATKIKRIVFGFNDREMWVDTELSEQLNASLDSIPEASPV
jgi:hypothetical protein